MKNAPLERVGIAITVGAAALMLAGCVQLGGGPTTNTAPQEVETDVSELAIGACFNASLASGAPSSVDVIDCAGLHDFEVYQSVALDDGDFPGEAETEASAQDECSIAFEEFAGIAYSDSVLLVNYFYPSELTWATGDRVIICVVQDGDIDGTPLQVTGSLAGVAR